jgi:rare lipoprotein A
MKNCLGLFFLLGFFSGPLAAQEEEGMAAFYSNRYHGARTYNGERYNKNALTCAHKTYPMGTKLKVTCLDNDKSVVVRVNDRMSSKRNVIDLSRAAASKLGMIGKGTVKVKIELVKAENSKEAILQESEGIVEPKDAKEGKGQFFH